MSATTSLVTYSLSGQVRHQGLPVIGALVSLYDTNSHLSREVARAFDSLVAQEVTGPKGEFSFPVGSGTYKIEVEPAQGTRLLKGTVPEVRVHANANVGITLQTGCIVSGRVADNSGNLLAGCEVVAMGIEPVAYTAAGKINQKGEYSLLLPKGMFHIGSRCLRDHSTPQLKGYNPCAVPFLSTDVSVTSVQGDKEFDLKLPPMVTFTGQVVDLLGKPVDAAKVTLTPSIVREYALQQEIGLVAKTLSDRQGSFAFKVQPGMYDISIEPDVPGQYFGIKEEKIEIGTLNQRRFTLCDGYKLTGQVLSGPKSLSRALVRVLGIDSDAEFVTRTDEDGNYSFGLTPGRYRVFATAHSKDCPPTTIDGASYNELAPAYQTVRVGADTHTNLKLTEGTQLFGRVRDEQGRAATGVRVSVFLDTGVPLTDEKANTCLASRTANGGGRYCFFLPAGKYWIVVHEDVSHALQVEIQDEPVNLDLDWYGFCRLKFEILGEDGRKVPRVRFAYAPYGRDEHGVDESRGSRFAEVQAVTQDDGTLQVILPAGIYTLQFKPPVDGSYEGKAIRQLSIKEDMNRTIRLPLKVGSPA